MANASMLVLRYISSRSLTLERHVAHCDERLPQIVFCLFADRRNNPLCGVLMKILLVLKPGLQDHETQHKGQRLLLARLSVLLLSI